MQFLWLIHASFFLNRFSPLVFFVEKHDIDPPWEQKQPSCPPTQEEASQTPQWLKPGILQEQPPSAPFVRPGEQSTPGTHTGEEEEETPEQETHNGELNAFIMMLYVFPSG